MESPGFLLAPQGESTVEDLVKLNEGLKELRVGFGVAEVVAEEGGELLEAVQSTSSDHVEQFFRGERDSRGLNSTRAMAQRTNQH